MWKRIPAAQDAEERVQNQQRRTFTIIHTSHYNKSWNNLDLSPKPI